jgi:poly(beta-D-mannuronate) lyase
MTLRVAVTKTPTVKPHIVCAQIHDADDDVLMVRVEGKKLLVEGPGQKDVVLDVNYSLGTKFDIKIEASGGEIHMWHNGVRKLTWKTSRDGCYFKAGCYTQSNIAKGDQPESYGEVVIDKLQVEHANRRM